MIPRLLLVVALLCAGGATTLAEIPADGWSGQVQCAISVRAPGYQDDQTQTWALSGPPISRGDFRDYPAAWTVTGAGNKTATAGPGGAGTWTRTGSDPNGSLTIFVPAASTSIRVAPGQRPVTAAGGLRGTLGGAPFSSSADEWRFQYFDTPGAVSETHLSGSRTQTLSGAPGWRQPVGAQATETCTWNFTKAGGGPVGGVTAVRPTASAAAIAPTVAAVNIPLANRVVRPGAPATAAGAGAAAGSAGAAAGSAGAAAGSAGAAAGGAGAAAGGAGAAAGGAGAAAGSAGAAAGSAGAAAGGAGAAAGGAGAAAGSAGAAAGSAGAAAGSAGAAAGSAGAAAGSAGAAAGSASAGAGSTSAGAGASGGSAASQSSAANSVAAAVAPSGPVTASFSGPTSLTVSAGGTFQLAVTLPTSQTTVVTEHNAPSTASTPTTQTMTNVSIVTRTTVAFVVVSGEAIFNAAIYYPLNQNITLEKQSATVVLPASPSSPAPAAATFKFSTPGSRSVSVVASVVVERHDITQRTVTTTTTTHDSTCNCSDRTNTSTSSDPPQTQVSSKTLYMIGAPPAAPATFQVAVQ